jgi:two-component system response regulator DesR
MRFLVADDNADWRTIIAGALESEHDLVAFVERGDQILEAAQGFRPDLITLDVVMPGKSGLNVLPRLRAMLPEAIIIVISTTATPIYKEEAFARGADDYIEKRSVLSNLAGAVASARERNSERTGQ